MEDLEVKRVVVHSMEIIENDDRWSGLTPKVLRMAPIEEGGNCPDSLS